jgi:hypothetical protein
MSPPDWFRQFIQQFALCAQGHRGCRQSIMALHAGSFGAQSVQARIPEADVKE